jgi:hypothetical protein
MPGGGLIQMRPALIGVSLAIVLIALASQSARSTGAAPQASTNQGGRRGVKVTADNWDDGKHGSISNIAKLSFVNKRCRAWGADGDIDIDQTCLVVRTVKGGLVVIPNEYVDEEMKETLDQLGKKAPDRDKWIMRFYAIGGGEKPRQ